MSAFLEQVFNTFSKKIHDHDMIHLSIFCFLVSDKMKIWHCGFASELMNKFALPEQHDMLLIFHGLFYLGCEVVSCLLLLNLV